MREFGPDIGKRLRQAREASGLTVRDLAHKAHTSKTTVLAISEGRGGNSSINLLARLARGLGVTPEWLAYGAGPGPGEEATALAAEESPAYQGRRQRTVRGKAKAPRDS